MQIAYHLSELWKRGPFMTVHATKRFLAKRRSYTKTYAYNLILPHYPAMHMYGFSAFFPDSHVNLLGELTLSHEQNSAPGLFLFICFCRSERTV